MAKLRNNAEQWLIILNISKNSNDMVIDYEHQSINAGQNGKPAPAAGWFKNLQWCKDGLYVVDARWTELAKRAINAQEYRYISPVFTYGPITGHVRRIVSLAITNTPSLDGLTDLTALKRIDECKRGIESVPASRIVANLFSGV